MDKVKEFIPENAQTVLVFFVNGKKVIENNPDPECTLLWYLRNKLQLTGTKFGCGEGGCGACTVMISQYMKHEDRIKNVAVNACLTPVCAVHGLAVTTIEGIGSTQNRLHPVQERLAKSHGSQCGFCTPGIIMSMYALIRTNNSIQYKDIEKALQGNLCRCTGYRPIIEGFKTFIEGWETRYCTENNKTVCKLGKDCCRNNNTEREPNYLYDKSAFQPYDETQEPIFPPELKINTSYSEEYVYFKGENVTWIRPKYLKELLFLKSKVPICKLILGNTEIGVETKFKKKVYPILVYPTLIKEMLICMSTSNGIIVGGAVTLSELNIYLKSEIKQMCKSSSRVFVEIQNMLHWFAGDQIRNVASLVGNIITASPISDLNPILMASRAMLNVYSLSKGCRKVFIDENFFVGYRTTVLDNDEVVVSVEIPLTESTQYIKAYKQARRREDDISIVTAAFSIEFKPMSNIVSQAKLCFGGMAPTTICATKTSKLMVGYEWNQKLLTAVFQSLNEELQLDISVPGGMPDYRKSLCLSLFFKFYFYISQNLSNGYKLQRDFQFSGLEEMPSIEPTSSQYYDIKNSNRSISDAVGQPIPHASALKQVSGEAMYCDDIPHTQGELFLALVLSSEAHAKIISVDASRALLVPGVVKFLTASDLEADRNKMGSILKDEEIFSKDIVVSRACIIGAIVAETEKAARKAKDLVSVRYERLEPIIVTLEDAIEKQSFFEGYPRVLKKGNVTDIISDASNIVEGTVRNGAQEHFYLETISAYAIRKEDELEVIAATQSPGEIAQFVSHALGIPNHKVISKVKRIGGGFGGKETKSATLAVPVAIAAYKLKKPVRAVLDRDEDIQISGYRHPCLIKYKVAFDGDGKILGAVYDIYSNAGYSMDISCSMIERAIFHVDNCYSIPNIQVNAYLCKTNLPSNTAFRGFGAPQAMFAAETMIRHIASALNKGYEEIATINMYKEGSLTHLNQSLIYCTLERCWNECIETSDYWQRKNDVEEFNRTNRWKKKAISIVPTKYGISFQTDILMQGGALLLVYVDGSVLLSIGGIEMGQGLFTKMIQVASRALEIDYQKIHISEAATDKVPNSSPTAASVSSDLYGMAVVNACEELKTRLQPYKVNNPNGKWEDWVSAAYLDRVSLFATGYYAAPKIEYNPETNTGNLFEYFTYGVAVSEVMIDCLTGDHQVLRTDIVMDLGESLNPAIDIGQIEGAFMQGYGMYTLEELIFSEQGETLSKGPGTYKIPGFSDIPKVFNVSLLKGAPNPRAVYSSKAVGEPPLFLAASVYFAIKEAIKSARLDAGVSPEFRLDAPATCARIRIACEDLITKQVSPTIKKNGKLWNVVA